ncbi:Na+/melibiose symporter-like transporter [Nocardioides albertanoniae]|uniref:Na+/melibiose symporter-like transporter n=1 Tax=Nocardioides albertanoniae TaxID=1175486 RepID=A0A543A5Z1_9ACTN|nr:MFS transporter [Nocardioides albertanoniae]TQL68012.1 Na+/melibiose symporter-like transporter [Nocardioides albertanoniae]
MPASPASAPLPTGVRLGYGLGSVATGTFGTIPGLMLLPYLTDSLGIAALAAGFIVFAPKAWDVVLNPIAGRISDRTVDPRGPRRPWLRRAGIALAVSFAVLFAAPSMATGLEALWVLVAFLACATAYAFFQVPYVAMPAELTGSYDERTRLMTWRVAILALTIMLAGATAPMIRDTLGGRDGYRVMGVVMAVLILVGVISAYAGTRRAPIHTVQPGAGGLRDQLRIVAAAPDFRRLLVTFVIQAVAFGAMLAGVDYLAANVLGGGGAATVLFVCFVGPALLLTPAWTALGTRIGKKGGYVAASVVLAVGALIAATAQAAPVAVVYAAVLLVGTGYAGCQVFPMAMLPDAAAVDARRSGSSRIGVYTGVWTAGETLGLALGPGVYAAVLALGGYRSSTGGAVDQPDSALAAITLGFSVLPACLALLSLLWLRRYSLTATDVDDPDDPDDPDGTVTA